MFDKKKLFAFLKIPLLLSILLLLWSGIPFVLSRYETVGEALGEINVAFYLLNDEYMSSNVALDNLVPSSDPYLYTFKVANYKDGDRTETALEYELSVVTTTNLPLTYELYMNESYDTDGAQTIIINDVIEKDEDGTYFRTLETEKKSFGHQENEENFYTLVIYFPETYKSYEYQDIIENIEIKVDSRQIIAEDNTV